MVQDIRKLADWLVKVTHEGIAVEQRAFASKAAEKKAQQKAISEAPRANVS